MGDRIVAPAQAGVSPRMAAHLSHEPHEMPAFAGMTELMA